jgi:hypothetical protein
VPATSLGSPTRSRQQSPPLPSAAADIRQHNFEDFDIRIVVQEIRQVLLHSIHSITLPDRVILGETHLWVVDSG